MKESSFLLFQNPPNGNETNIELDITEKMNTSLNGDHKMDFI